MKKKQTVREPEFYTSATNIRTINYRVYYMKPWEKILYFMIAFIAGACVGYLFYGGIGKDEFGEATRLTWILNITIPTIVGIIAGRLFLPMRVKSIIEKRKSELNHQFRDMLEALTTSLGAGKNVNDSFLSVYEDLKIQYDSDAYILKELEVIISGIHNNVAVEEILEDLGKRSDNDDIWSFAKVFKISYRKGGNIKDIIRNTHSILSDKMEIAEDIETLVTSNRMEQNIMVVMPIALIGLIKMMSPEFAANFVSVTGLISTTISIVIFIIAYFIGKTILDIKI
ncbi:MAG TPA: hypothetical protein H9776_00280 [Candidatus Mediterraneibacter intestinipullorum]|nr:hypothetical protein [Candidatus Mediterraneibacter intestinipullorum]